MLQIAGLETEKIFSSDAGIQPVSHQALLDLDLGAIGERGHHGHRVVLLVGPKAHVFRRRVAVQKGLHVAVDQRGKPHGNGFFVKGGKTTRLIPFSLGQKPLVHKMRTDRGMKFGVQRDHGFAGFEDRPHGRCRVGDIAGALEHHVAFVDQLIERVRECLLARVLGAALERPSGQDLAEFVS